MGWKLGGAGYEFTEYIYIYVYIYIYKVSVYLYIIEGIGIFLYHVSFNEYYNI